MYKLYGTRQTRTIRPLWLLEELEQPYTLIEAAPRAPEVLAVSPLGKVPVLQTEDGVIFDSVAQMTYLADRHGGFTHPAGSFARGQQDGLTNTINETFDAVLWSLAKHSFILPPEHRVEAVKDSLKWQMGQHAAAMADILGEGPYLMGEGPVLPDFLLAHCCGWALSRKIDLPGRLREHMNMMRARPAYRRATANA